MKAAEELENRLVEFTISILSLMKMIPRNIENEVFFKQIIRSASSIGANYAEAVFAHSRIEFIHCINISRKETNETIYWLKVIKKANSQHTKNIDNLIDEATSLLKIFISSIKTAKSNLKIANEN